MKLQTPGKHNEQWRHGQKPERPPHRKETQVLCTVSEIGAGVQKYARSHIKNDAPPDEAMPLVGVPDLFLGEELG
jgi:hypothetical protein